MGTFELEVELLFGLSLFIGVFLGKFADYELDAGRIYFRILCSLAIPYFIVSFYGISFFSIITALLLIVIGYFLAFPVLVFGFFAIMHFYYADLTVLLLYGLPAGTLIYDKERKIIPSLINAVLQLIPYYALLVIFSL